MESSPSEAAYKGHFCLLEWGLLEATFEPWEMLHLDSEDWELVLVLIPETSNWNGYRGNVFGILHMVVDGSFQR